MLEKQEHSAAPVVNGSSYINPLVLLRVIVRRKMVMITICSMAIALSVGWSLMMKNVYTASSTILPPPREYGVGGAGAGASGASLLFGASALQNSYLELYVNIFKSRTVVESVIKRLDLQKVFKSKHLDAARNRVLASVKFKSGKDGTITISARNKDPQFAAKLVNTFVEEMSRRSSQLYITKVGSERTFLEKRINETRKELTTAEDALKAFQEKHKTLKADGQASIAVEGIARLRMEIVNKEVQLATLRNSLTDESNEVKALQAAIVRLKGQLGSMSGSGGTVNVIPSVGNVPGILSEFHRLAREVKYLETVLEQMAKQYELAKLNESRDTTSIQVIDEAVPPLIKSGPRRSRFVIVSAIAAFFTSIVVIFVQEALSKVSPENAEIINDIKDSLRFRRRKA